MMEFLASLLVQKPLNIAVVAVLFGIGYLVRRFAAAGEAPHAWWLLVAAAGWALYAAWEWLVMTRTPEADIRVDLLLIWPVLLLLSAWGVFKAVKG